MSQTDSPIRLAFCITELDHGGAEQALVELATRLDPARWKIAVYCLSGPGPLVENLIQADVRVHCLGARSKYDLGVIWRLARLLRGFRPSLLQTYLFHANMAGRLAGRMAGVQTIVSGIRVAEHRGRRYLWLDRLTNSLVDHNVCVSQAVADFSVRKSGLKREKITVIPNGVDARKFAEAVPADLSEMGIPPGSRTVISVGRLDLQKAPLLLLEAVEPLFRVYENLHVLYVGDGPLRDELQARISAKHLEGRIHLAGWRVDVAELLKASCCLALSSQWEGMPNVVLEAMAAGLPVVATRVEGTSELLRDRENGLLVEPGAPADLQAALEEIVAHPQQAAVMGKAAQELVERQYTWDSTVARYERLYFDLLGCQTQETARNDVERKPSSVASHGK